MKSQYLQAMMMLLGCPLVAVADPFVHTISEANIFRPDSFNHPNWEVSIIDHPSTNNQEANVVLFCKLKEGHSGGHFKVALTYLPDRQKWALTTVDTFRPQLPRGATLAIWSIPQSATAVKHRWAGPDGRTQGGFNGSPISELQDHDSSHVILTSRVVRTQRPPSDMQQDMGVIFFNNRWNIFGPPVANRGDLFHVVALRRGLNQVGNMDAFATVTAGNNPISGSGIPFVTEIMTGRRPVGYTGASQQKDLTSVTSFGSPGTDNRSFHTVLVAPAANPAGAAGTAGPNVKVTIDAQIPALVFKTEPGRTEALAVLQPINGRHSLVLPNGSEIRLRSINGNLKTLVRKQITQDVTLSFPEELPPPAERIATVTLNYDFPMIVFKEVPGQGRRFAMQSDNGKGAIRVPAGTVVSILGVANNRTDKATIQSDTTMPLRENQPPLQAEPSHPIEVRNSSTEIVVVTARRAGTRPDFARQLGFLRAGATRIFDIPKAEIIRVEGSRFVEHPITNPRIVEYSTFSNGPPLPQVVRFTVRNLATENVEVRRRASTPNEPFVRLGFVAANRTQAFDIPPGFTIDLVGATTISQQINGGETMIYATKAPPPNPPAVKTIYGRWEEVRSDNRCIVINIDRSFRFRQTEDGRFSWSGRVAIRQGKLRLIGDDGSEEIYGYQLAGKRITFTDEFGRPVTDFHWIRRD